MEIDLWGLVAVRRHDCVVLFREPGHSTVRVVTVHVFQGLLINKSWNVLSFEAVNVFPSLAYFETSCLSYFGDLCGGTDRQLLLPGLISLSVAASFQSGLDFLSFPGNKPIISWSQFFVFVTVWWCDRVPQGALFSPVATHQTAPTPLSQTFLNYG